MVHHDVLLTEQTELLVDGFCGFGFGVGHVIVVLVLAPKTSNPMSFSAF